MTEITVTGARRIPLFLPFDVLGRHFDVIEFGPVEFDVTLRWTEGKFPSPVALMAELAGVEEMVIRKIRYPDLPRVMADFLLHVPPEIRADIESGALPVYRPGAVSAPASADVARPDVTASPPADSARSDFAPAREEDDGRDFGVGFDLTDG